MKFTKYALKTLGFTVVILGILFSSNYNPQKAQALNPDDVSGLLLWLKADAITGLNNGDQVSSWNDSSGNGYNATQGTSSFRPTYQTNVLNGQPVVRFDGTDDRINFNSLSNIRTAIFVYKWTGSYNDYAPVLGGDSTYDFHGGSGAILLDNDYSSANIRSGSAFVNGESTSTSSLQKPAQYQILTLKTVGNVTGSNVGTDRNAGTRYWRGDYAEVILFNTALSDSDRQGIEDYLSTKYNISVSANNTPTKPLHVLPSPRSGEVVLNWTAPSSDGGSSITDYKVEYKESGGSYSTFSDGVSTSTTATVTGLTNNTTYVFRVSAQNSNGYGAYSDESSTTPNSVILSDSYTGTTIDSSKWVEIDPGGSGGSTGNVQQNNALTVLGTSAWGANGVRSTNTYSRATQDIWIDTQVSATSCSGIPMGIGYGDFDIYANPGAAYIVNYGGSGFTMYYLADGGGTQQTSSYTISCSAGQVFQVRLRVKSGGGAEAYINGASTPSMSVAGGTFDNESVFLQSYPAGVTVNYDNTYVTQYRLVPDQPTALTPSAGNGQVGLSWTTPSSDGGSAITDYIVEYKTGSDSYSTFNDGVGTGTSATVTGLTNGLTYTFRVSAVNSNGTGSPSSTANSTPVTATPAAPSAQNVSISGTAALDETLTGTYTYVDANGDAEATSTYQWYRSDTLNGTYTAIPSATTTTYAIQGSDQGKYLKFSVTPISSASPTTGSAVTTSASGPVTVALNYYNHILITGQSLSVGSNGSPALSTSQPFSNKGLSGTTLIPLVESGVETIGSAMANGISNQQNGYNSIVTGHGAGATAYTGLKKGTTPYNNGIAQVNAGKTASDNANVPYKVVGVSVIHGESDHLANTTQNQYKLNLAEWQNDYDTDIKAITGQSQEVRLFTDQMSSHTFYGNATSVIPFAQLDAHIAYPDQVILVGPKYFLNYSDGVHLNNTSYRWLGEYYAKVMKKVLVDGETWDPLRPTSVVRSGNIIYAHFNVPEGPLAFDTSLVSARTNYGFEYYDSTSSATISSVELEDADTVKVTLSGVPTGTGQRLRYAYTGTGGANAGAQSSGSAAGNLRDSDSTTSLSGNTLYNWAVHFNEAITLDSTAPTITNISSDKANGTYSEGEVIDIDVTFSEAVTSTGNVTVTLETGTVDRTCTFAISNATSGTCNYTIQGGDTSSDLTVSSISGTIADQNGNSMVSFSPATNLAANKALVIDTTSSEISLVTSTPSPTTASITWTTNEASSSIVDYGLTSSYGTSTVEADTTPRVTSHTVNLSGLVACTTYNYRVKSKDAANNLTTGSNNTFTTTGCTGSAEVISEESESVPTATGGDVELDNSGEGLLLDIPAGATNADAVFQIKQLDEDDTTATTGVPSGFLLADGHIYNLSALTGVGTAVTSFDEDIEITITYSDADVVGMNESSLVIYHYSGGVWSALTPCTVNTAANTVTCSTDSFSIFALVGPATSSSSSSSGSVTRHPVGTNIVDSTGTIYTLTSDGKRRPYTSAGAYLSYGFNTWANTVPARSSDLGLPVGDFIPPRDGSITCSDRGSDKGTCYLITNGMKAGFVSEKVFKALGFSFQNAIYGDVSFMSSTENISDPNSSHRSGTLINNSGTLQVIKDNALAGIPSMEVLTSWGYNPLTAVVANTADKLLQQTQVLVTRAAGVLNW